MDKFKSKILKEIKKVNPRSRLTFIVQNIFWWSLFVFFTLFWAFAFHVVLFLIFSSDWNFYEYVYSWKVSFFLNIFPYFWLLVFLLFLSLAFIYTRFTNNAYKIWYLKIVLISSFLSLFIWFFWYIYWISYWNIFEEAWHFWRKIQGNCEKQWMNPRKWRLIGEVKKIWKSWFSLTDARWVEWKVNKPMRKWENNIDLFTGEKIRISWKAQSNRNFKAWKILPGCFWPNKRWVKMRHER